MKKSLEERFWEKVNKRGPDDCWEWTAARTQGYGVIKASFPDRRMLRAHRVSYEINKGKIPEGWLVRHICDNPGCVNPDHLLSGTWTDNMKDRDSRNRQARGERQGLSKLTEDDVRAIRKDVRSQEAIARDYGIAQTGVSFIKRRKTWKHVKD